ncbi:MAG: sulfatase-like hydrolase/transferase [Promethearchaeota archaeon]
MPEKYKKNKSKKKPHIIIFNPDQWRGDVLGHVGNPAASTPYLDKIVKEDAVSFSQAYCQNPVCTPSRCSFMTGWYPHTSGHRTMHHMLHLERNEPNLLKILKDNGYFVWWGGKNDLIPGQYENPFNNYCNIKYRPTKEDFKRWGHKIRPSLHIWEDWRGKPDTDEYYSFFAGKLEKGEDDIWLDIDWMMILGAMDFIKNYEGEKPLCIYLPITKPHPPYGVCEPWFSRINRNKLPPRKKTPKNWEGKPSILKEIYKGQNLQTWTEDRWNELRATYYGMIARLDYQFEQLMNVLKKKGIYDDCAVFLFSDHGDYTGDYGIVEKTQNTFEDCLTRIPFIIKPPKNIPIKPRVCNTTFVELIDFSATVYSLAGITPNYTYFGKSLLPLIEGKTEQHRNEVFCEGGRLMGEKQAMEKESLSRLKPEQWTKTLYWPRIRLQISDDESYHTKATMCRTKDYKYNKRLYEQDELYDLRKDPDEMKNVIDDPSYAKILLELKDKMLTWYQRTCDVVPFETDSRF